MGKARREAKQAQTLLFFEIPTESGNYGGREVYADYAAMFKAATETYAHLLEAETEGLLGWIRISKVPLVVGAPVEQIAVHPVTGMPVEGMVVS